MGQSQKKLSENEAKQRSSFRVALCISISLMLILIWDLTCKGESRLTTPHIVLIALAILPWAGQFLNSFKLSASGLEADFKALEQKLETVVEAAAEPEVEQELAATATVVELTETDVRILNALTSSRFALRSWSGIKTDAKLQNKPETLVLLEDLQSRNLVQMTVGPKSGNKLWSITTDGYRALRHNTSDPT
ncbi:hypothetical protein [Shimia sagamensis]|uniref:HTH marR-type domain-containing protein n=1 Tax=Shimia sagamensis TaxID=1566352 RepID=A0ABY1NU42_9RHOB|nr:hypothetical protein [Shimia sagamensis]SMP18209.1 hypothetical protein SAMN06265373_103244 [Shimia sagamensis]